jgi:hypothetical protein
MGHRLLKNHDPSSEQPVSSQEISMVLEGSYPRFFFE